MKQIHSTKRTIQMIKQFLGDNYTVNTREFDPIFNELKEDKDFECFSEKFLSTSIGRLLTKKSIGESVGMPLFRIKEVRNGIELNIEFTEFEDGSFGGLTFFYTDNNY